MKVKVITDSGSGLTKEQAAEYGLDFLPLQVIIEDKAYLDGIYFDKHFIIDIFNGNINDRSNMAVLFVCKCQKRREIF